MSYYGIMLWTFLKTTGCYFLVSKVIFIQFFTWNVSNNQKSLDEFYDFEDETGLLDRHRQLFTEEPSEKSCLSRDLDLDIKTMFYELIKMLWEFQNRKNGCHRQIHKIDGFQELSNKLFLHKIKNLRLIKIFQCSKIVIGHKMHLLHFYGFV